MTAAHVATDALLPTPVATLLVGIDPTEEVARLYGPNRPLILVNAFDPSMRFDCVAPNNFYGALMATRALLAAGHRRLLHLRNHRRWTTLERLRGFHAALAEVRGASGIVVDLESSAEPLIPQLVADRKAGRTNWSAAFCMHDQSAIPLVHALIDAGLDVPGQISVVGFDDLAPAAMMTPRLATMRVECAALAAESIALVLRRSQQPEATPVQIECAVSLIHGETIAQIA
jgi:DNA-binding LacI/PurR family transcriptional regulator